MKIKLKNRPNVSNEPLIIHVQWTDQEGGSKQKKVDKILPNQIYVVDDQLGYIILGQYPGCFEIVSEDAAEKPSLAKASKEAAPVRETKA